MIMKNFIFIIILLIPRISIADCFDIVGKKYNYDPDYLRAIAFKESSFNPKAIGYNKNGSKDFGLMQINSNNIEKLRDNFPNISIRNLLVDPCFNIHVGGFILNENFKLYGKKWVAIGAYNAGLKNNPKIIKKRYTYALSVNKHYNDIKRGNLYLPKIKINNRNL